MVETIISISIGFLFGIIASLLAWWFQSHLIVPNIQFSQNISKIPSVDKKSRYKYRIKLENSGKRSVIDIEIMARLRIKGVGDFPNNWRVNYIPLEEMGINYRIPIITRKKEIKSGHIITFDVNEVVDFKKLETLERYPDNIKRKAKEKTLLLEDVLRLGSEANIRIEAFGFDEFSGARKFFKSEFYTIHNIKEGRFHNGLDIKQLNNQKHLHLWEKIFK